MYIYIYIHRYVYIYMYRYAYIHIYKYNTIYVVYIYICYIYIYIYVYYIYIYYTYKYIYIYTCIYIYIHVYTYTLHLCKILPVWLNNKNLYRLTQKTSIAQKNFVSGFSRVSQPTCPIIHSWKPQTNCFLVLSLDSRLSNTMGSLKAGPQHSCLQQVTF